MTVASQFPLTKLENAKSPHPEDPGKLLKNHNLVHPGGQETVLRITEKLPKNTEQVYFLYFGGNVRAGPGWAKL